MEVFRFRVGLSAPVRSPIVTAAGEPFAVTGSASKASQPPFGCISNDLFRALTLQSLAQTQTYNLK